MSKGVEQFVAARSFLFFSLPNLCALRVSVVSAFLTGIHRRAAADAVNAEEVNRILSVSDLCDECQLLYNWLIIKCEIN